jgi:hypothetical protein
MSFVGSCSVAARSQSKRQRSPFSLCTVSTSLNVIYQSWPSFVSQLRRKTKRQYAPTRFLWERLGGEAELAFFDAFRCTLASISWASPDATALVAALSPALSNAAEGRLFPILLLAHCPTKPLPRRHIPCNLLLAFYHI